MKEGFHSLLINLENDINQNIVDNKNKFKEVKVVKDMFSFTNKINNINDYFLSCMSNLQNSNRKLLYIIFINDLY